VISVVLLLAMVAGGLWLLPTVAPGPAPGAQDVREALGSATSARVEIGFGAGILTIDGMSSTEDLLTGSVDLHPGERLERSRDDSGGQLQVALASRGSWASPIFGWEGRRAWDLRLNDDVPMALEIDAGVGDVTADLRRLTLTALSLSTGVGRTTVILPERGQLFAKIDVGVGDLVVKVPQGVEVRITTDTGLGSVSVPSDYVRSDGGYVSPGYASATEKVDIDLDTGIGRISVREHAGE
jgi:hypothetical protein